MSNFITWKEFLTSKEINWEITKFGNLFSNRKEKGRQNLPLLSVSGSLGVIDRDQLEKRDTSNSDKRKYLRVVDGDIVYNTMRMWQGVSGVVQKEGIVSPAYTVVTPNKYLNKNYAKYLMKNDLLIQMFHKNSQGMVDDTLNLKFPNFASIDVRIPPLIEQKKIASILTSVDEVIENTQKQIDKLQDLKKAIMNELLTRGIGHTEFKDSELGRIPKSWEVKKLGELFVLTSGKSKPKRLLSSVMTNLNAIPVYGGNGVNGYTDSALLDNSTIIIGRVGEYCGCVEVTPKFSWITDNALYIKTVLKQYDMQFLFYLMTFSNLSKLRSKGGQPLVSQQPIHEYQVALPPLNEQNSIASIIAAIDSKILVQIQKLSQTQSLKKSLMQDLLTGKVRVSVN